MGGEISVIIRNKNDPNILGCIDSFRQVPRQTFELIIVDSSSQPLHLDSLPFNISYVYEQVSRFEALNLGIKMAQFNSILIIDSDQIVSPALISELNRIEEDLCIIREMSYNRNFIGRISDRHREFLYRHSKKHISDSIPVIPRFYRREIIVRAMSKLERSELSLISQHEDSVIYSEVLKISEDVAFCDTPIFDIDPDFKVFVRKSFRYGVAQAKALSSNRISKDRADLLRSIDRNRIIYSDSEGFNKGIFYDVLKATFYIAGFLLGKLQEWRD